MGRLMPLDRRYARWKSTERVTDCHHRCPPAGPRQKNFRNHPSHPTTCRHAGTKFGQISARSKMGIGKPLICIGFATCERGKFGGWFGLKQWGVRPTKKALQILDL